MLMFLLTIGEELGGGAKGRVDERVGELLDGGAGGCCRGPTAREPSGPVFVPVPGVGGHEELAQVHRLCGAPFGLMPGGLACDRVDVDLAAVVGGIGEVVEGAEHDRLCCGWIISFLLSTFKDQF